MTQRILIELLLFLAPFAVFLIYRAASRDLQVKDRWPLTRLVVIGAVIAVLGLIIPPLLEPHQTDICYEPTRYTADRQIVPARQVPCTEATLPGSNQPAPPPAETPVAPRDRRN